MHTYRHASNFRKYFPTTVMQLDVAQTTHVRISNNLTCSIIVCFCHFSENSACKIHSIPTGGGRHFIVNTVTPIAGCRRLIDFLLFFLFFFFIYFFPVMGQVLHSPSPASRCHASHNLTVSPMILLQTHCKSALHFGFVVHDAALHWSFGT